MSATIYFLRHGETTFSRDNMFCGSGVDAALTDNGKEMAQAFCAYYQNYNWSAIYSSPLQRARDTALPISNIKKMGLTISDSLREISFGDWDGKTVEEVKAKYPELHRNWDSDPAQYSPPGGETAIQVAERGLQFVRDALSENLDGNILAVSHKATIRLAVCGLLGISPSLYRVRLDCPVGSVTAIEIRKSGPFLKALAERSHLGTRLRNLSGT